MKHTIWIVLALAIGCGDAPKKEPVDTTYTQDCQPGDPTYYCASSKQLVTCTADGPEYRYCSLCYRNETNQVVCDD